MPKIIPWWSPQIAGQEYALIQEVLDSNYLNDGEVTTRFEQEIARLVGVKYAVAVTSGTTAIFLALAGIGVGPGDEVIVPDVTFIATANAVTLTGAKPVLVDIDPLSLNISPEAVRAAITTNTKAIIPVHVSGRAADMTTIQEIASEYGLALVEDAAEAFMSASRGRFLGTFGIAGCLSFSPNKTITTGQGGMILTDDDALHIRLRELKDQGRPVRGTGGDDVHRSVGYNFKYTNLQAAVGLAQLMALDVRLKRQKQIHCIYAAELSGMTGISLLPFDIKGGEIPQWTDAIVERRDNLDRYLLEKDIHCRRFWHPVHTQSPYFEPDDAFPNSTRLMTKAIWLPSAFTLSDEDMHLVCQSIRQFTQDEKN
jgi:perosamine synthetase